MKENEKNKKSKKETIRITLLIIAIVILICSTAYIGYYIYAQIKAENEYKDLTTTSQQETLPQQSLAENPIDFESLQSGNDEIYSWITIDDTEVNYPIVQSKSDDNFYLKHSAIDKKWLDSGAIYTELKNSTDYSDPITVIYGHNGYKQTMFTTLHKFEKKDFFDSHKYFTIYTKDKKLTYEVISAFKFDDRHILNSYDFTKSEDLKEFQDIITNPNSTVKNVRNDLDIPINEHSQIVVLSTCITNQKSNRFLVSGVLVNEENTK